MNQKYHLIPILSVALLFGCGQKDKPAESGTISGGLSNAAQAVQSEAKDLAQSTQKALTETKEQFTALMNQQLQDWDKKLAALGSQVEALTADAKVKGGQALDLARQKREVVAAKMKELQSAGDDTWQKVKADVEAALQDLEKQFNAAQSSLQT